MALRGAVVALRWNRNKRNGTASWRKDWMKEGRKDGMKEGRCEQLFGVSEAFNHGLEWRSRGANGAEGCVSCAESDGL